MSGGWPAARWLPRVLLAVFVGFMLLPFLLGVVLAAVFAGSTGAAVAAVVGLGVVTAGVFMARFTRQGFAGVGELVAVLGRLADGDYGARVSGTRIRALWPVATSLNGLAERLEQSDGLRRQLLADVGHELRTPLTIVRGELEAMLDGVRELSREDLERLLGDLHGMERLLDDLKTLSATEAGVLALEREPTDLVALAFETAERFGNEAQRLGVALHVETDETVSSGSGSIEVDVDTFRIGEVLSNLVVNALRVVDRGGRIQIRVGREMGDGQGGGGGGQ